MKLTPLDIHHKEFHHALRGYSEEEVDTFLDEVADEFERLFKENIDLSEKLESASARVRDYQSMEVTLNNTMVSAQRSAEQIVAQANEEASAMVSDAEVKAKEIIHSALTDKQRAQGELVRIKQAEEDFRGRFQSLLEQHLSGISEIPLSADVAAMVGEARTGMVAGMDAEPEPIRVTPEFTPEPADQVASDEMMSDSAATATDDVALTSDDPMPAADAATTSLAAKADKAQTADVPVADAAASVMVESMSFGELDGPDLADEEFGEPREFSVPSLDEFGERDDEADIEEID